MSTGTHTEHCCETHGCKYNDDDCPVVLGSARQVDRCQDCEVFTFDEVCRKARESLIKSGLPKLGLCLDQEREAMSKHTLEEAARVLVDDSLYWGGYFC